MPAGVETIHTTRRAMLDATLEHTLGTDYSKLTALDLACHQGYFALHLARRGFRDVLGVDAREAHLDDARLIAEPQGVTQLRTQRVDLEEASAAELGLHDVTLMFGLLYHLENPVRALRLARAATRRLFVIETQVVPHVTGEVDWGAESYRKPLVGVFGIVDEIDEIHGPEASTRGICLAPSLPALGWLLQRVGFSNVTRVVPPPGGNEQLARHRRVMLAATV